MPRKKREAAKSANVRVGNLSDISGTVNIAGGDIKTYSTQTTTGLSAGEIRQLFDLLYARIEARPETPLAAKQDLKADVKEIQTAVTEAVQKSEKVDESFLSRRFRNIARMAPDLLEVVVATLGNPLSGLGVAVKKIADKAKEETGTAS